MKLWSYLLIGALQSGIAFAEEPICHDFESKIEPDMQRQEADFTHENYVASKHVIETTVRDWMENKYERNKKNPIASSKLFDGEIWLTHANHNAVVEGYVLKLEYLSASEEAKETSRQAFCEFLGKTPYYD